MNHRILLLLQRKKKEEGENRLGEPLIDVSESLKTTSRYKSKLTMPQNIASMSHWYSAVIT